MKGTRERKIVITGKGLQLTKVQQCCSDNVGRVKRLSQETEDIFLATFELEQDAATVKRAFEEHDETDVDVCVYSKYFASKFLHCDYIATETFVEVTVGEAVVKKLLNDALLLKDVTDAANGTDGCVLFWIEQPDRVGFTFLPQSCSENTARFQCNEKFIAAMNFERAFAIEPLKQIIESEARYVSAKRASCEVVIPGIDKDKQIFLQSNSVQEYMKRKLRGGKITRARNNLVRLPYDGIENEDRREARDVFIKTLARIKRREMPVPNAGAFKTTNARLILDTMLDKNEVNCFWKVIEKSIVFVALEDDHQSVQEIFESAFEQRTPPMAEPLNSNLQKVKVKAQQKSNDASVFVPTRVVAAAEQLPHFKVPSTREPAETRNEMVCTSVSTQTSHLTDDHVPGQSTEKGSKLKSPVPSHDHDSEVQSSENAGGSLQQAGRPDTTKTCSKNDQRAESMSVGNQCDRDNSHSKHVAGTANVVSKQENLPCVSCATSKYGNQNVLGASAVPKEKRSAFSGTCIQNLQDDRCELASRVEGQSAAPPSGSVENILSTSQIGPLAEKGVCPTKEDQSQQISSDRIGSLNSETQAKTVCPPQINSRPDTWQKELERLNSQQLLELSSHLGIDLGPGLSQDELQEMRGLLIRRCVTIGQADVNKLVIALLRLKYPGTADTHNQSRLNPPVQVCGSDPASRMPSLDQTLYYSSAGLSEGAPSFRFVPAQPGPLQFHPPNYSPPTSLQLPMNAAGQVQLPATGYVHPPGAFSQVPMPATTNTLPANGYHFLAPNQSHTLANGYPAHLPGIGHQWPMINQQSQAPCSFSVPMAQHRQVAAFRPPPVAEWNNATYVMPGIMDYSLHHETFGNRHDSHA